MGDSEKAECSEERVLKRLETERNVAPSDNGRSRLFNAANVHGFFSFHFPPNGQRFNLCYPHFRLKQNLPTLFNSGDAEETSCSSEAILPKQIYLVSVLLDLLVLCATQKPRIFRVHVVVFIITVK